MPDRSADWAKGFCGGSKGTVLEGEEGLEQLRAVTAALNDAGGKRVGFLVRLN